jgi:hypothetical protein
MEEIYNHDYKRLRRERKLKFCEKCRHSHAAALMAFLINLSACSGPQNRCALNRFPSSSLVGDEEFGYLQDKTGLPSDRWPQPAGLRI